MLKITLISLLTTCIFNLAHASQTEQNYDYQINASAFMLANLIDDEPKYGHIEISKPINADTLIGIEFLTWQYSNPLGIPYGPKFDNPEEAFPGYIQDFGLGLTYQHFFYEQFFYKLHSTAFYQRYLDEHRDTIQSGFKLFAVARTGYKWEFGEGKYFVEPSIAVTSWPIDTNMPEDFQVVEEKWPKYFLFEPGLNLGFRF